MIKSEQWSKNYIIIFAMFVMSGFAGLMYQVIFSKALALIFGSTSTATYTVLSTYMGGMAIGSWLGGQVAHKVRNPIKIYGYCELGIALFCAITPMIFIAIKSVYIILASDINPDSSVLVFYRLLLGSVSLLVPTILMGMTLPILAKYFELQAESLGRSVGFLYTANTVGAASGALLTGYLLLPAIGVYNSTLLAVAFNAFIALYAFQLDKTAGVGASAKAGTVNSAEPVSVEKRFAIVAFGLLTIGGFVTLGLEVVYIHLLAVVAGNSTYAFSLMLFAFLLGLSSGSEVARRLLSWQLSLPALLLILEASLCFVIIFGLFIWDSIPDYFASFANYPLARTFSQREVIRGLICLLIMMPPAFFIGALYPICMECIGRFYVKNKSRALGLGACLNTIGNIAGVLVTGFFLLPKTGAFNAVFILASIVLILYIVMAVFTWAVSRKIVVSSALTLIILYMVSPSGFDYTKLSTGANVYFQPQGYGSVIDFAESIDGGLTTVARAEHPNQGEVLTLLTNGKFQGDNGEGHEMKAQAGFALAPLMFTTKRDNALVIGYGTGMSARVIHDAGFKKLVIVDLSKDIVTLADKHFEMVNRGVTQQDNVDVHYTDGRNFLMVDDERFDLISMEISSIWFAGAASLYNQEFYQLVDNSLKKDGVLQQWVQLHRISKMDIFYILSTVRSVFENVWLYEIGSQGIIVATQHKALPNEETLHLLTSSVHLQDIIALYEGGVQEVLAGCLLAPEDVDNFLLSFGNVDLVSTDDNMFLEYSTPKGNVRPYYDSIMENFNFLNGYRTDKCNTSISHQGS